MSKTTTPSPTLAHLPELLAELSPRLEAFKSTIVAGTDDDAVIETAEALWTILDEAIDVLETIDFEDLPEAIDRDEFPDAIEVEKLPTAVETGNAIDAIDLTELHEAVDLRKLWKAVDIPALRKEHEELAAEIEAFLESDDEDANGSNDEGRVDVEGTVSGLFSAESRQQALQKQIGKAIDAFRIALFETHATIRRLYEANQRKLGQSGRRSGSRNPTARSTLSRGPLPDSISTRVSTVPRQVRHSRTKARPRIYGRRFERVRR